MEYWMFSLFLLIVYGVIGALMLSGGAISAISGGVPEFGPMFWLGAIVAAIFVLASIVPMIAVIIRRLHDRDMSGWWYLGLTLAGAIPYVGILASIVFLVILCLPGTKGLNRYGDDPKNPVGYDVFA